MAISCGFGTVGVSTTMYSLFIVTDGSNISRAPDIVPPSARPPASVVLFLCSISCTVI